MRKLNVLLGLMAFWIVVPASADNFPSRPIKMVVPAAAGGSGDVTARIVSEELRKLGATIIVENMPGASGIIGAGAVARAQPDGYTFMASNSSTHAIAPFTFSNLTYHPLNDFIHISGFLSYPYIVVVDPSLRYQSLADMVTDAKRRPGELTNAYATDTARLIGSAFKKSVGIIATEVPYRSSPEIYTDLIGGRISFAVVDTVTAKALVESGRLKALVALAPERLQIYPDVPTLKEAGFTQLSITGWAGFSGPKGMPDEAIRWLDTNIRSILQRPDIIAKFEATGTQVLSMDSETFNNFVSTQLSVWKAAAEDSALKPQ